MRTLSWDGGSTIDSLKMMDKCRCLLLFSNWSRFIALSFFIFLFFCTKLFQVDYQTNRLHFYFLPFNLVIFKLLNFFIQKVKASGSLFLWLWFFYFTEEPKNLGCSYKQKTDPIRFASISGFFPWLHFLFEQTGNHDVSCMLSIISKRISSDEPKNLRFFFFFFLD